MSLALNHSSESMSVIDVKTLWSDLPIIPRLTGTSSFIVQIAVSKMMSYLNVLYWVGHNFPPKGITNM